MESIAKNEPQHIKPITEGNLYRAFYEGLQDLQRDFKSIQIVGIDYKDPLRTTLDKIKLEALDCHSFFNADINRETNKLNYTEFVDFSKNLMRFESESEDLLPLNF